MESRVTLFLALLLVMMVILSAYSQPTPTPTPTQAPVPTTAPIAVQPTAAPKSPEPTKASPPTTAPTTASTVAPASKYNEAPALAEFAKSGKLPAVDKRLPDNPLVYAGASVRTYGGNWRVGMRGSDYNMLFKTFGVDNLVTWTLDGKDIVANLAEKYEISTDGTEFTFYLRKGLKWSDGKPYTATDIEWWWANVAQNKDLEPAGFPSIQVNGEFGKFTKVDDYTFKACFPGLIKFNRVHDSTKVCCGEGKPRSLSHWDCNGASSG